MNTEARIRIATPADAPAIQAIYAPYVETTAITFELVPPSVEVMEQRITHTLSRYPYLVAERDGEVIGYCYVGQYRPRPAYVHSVETSIYMRQDRKGGGMGRRLYDAMAKLLELQNVYNMNACISFADEPSPYVSPASRAFHEKVGFNYVGRFTRSGHKFGRWFDIVWMERFTTDHPEESAPFVPFPEVDHDAVERILAQA